MSVPAQEETAHLGWRTLAAVVLFYTACVLLATYPVARTFSTRLAGFWVDPAQALWVMHWYKDCLAHGRSPLHCPDIQYPVGAHLGNFSPLYFQALLYLPLSCCLGNDVLCYNVIWLFNLVFTGLGTFLLVWHVLRDRACACLGGLLAMLSGPVLLHAHGHLELITLGWFPLFLVGWKRWVDEPNGRRLLVAVALYLLLTLSAAYFAVLGLVPAGGYVVWQACAAGRRGAWPWLRGRLVSFTAFVSLTAPCLLLLFAPQLCSRAQGYSAPRPGLAFDSCGADLWSYVTPSDMHFLGQFAPLSVWGRGTDAWVERGSYLGLVTLALIAYAFWARLFPHQSEAPARVCPRPGYWWALFALLVVLSLGASLQVAGHRVPLPAGWLRQHVFVFRNLRAPARFNLLAAVFGALLAAAGLRHLLARLPRRAARGAVFVAVTLLAVADLAMVPFDTVVLPALPACYALLRQQHPRATFLELPQFDSGTSALNAACGYWQTLHHGITTGGYSGFDNCRHSDLFVAPSPFAASLLQEPNYLQDPEAVSVDVVSPVRFADYAWLYLTTHHIDYLVLHRGPALLRFVPLDRLRTQLAGARISEDEQTAVYDASRLPRPGGVTLLCTEGWGARTPSYYYEKVWYGRRTAALSRLGRLAAFNPEGETLLTFRLEGLAFHQPRTVRLRCGDRELACWDVTPDRLRVYTSPPFRLPAGRVDLILESDGEVRPVRPGEGAREEDQTPFSLRVAGVALTAGGMSGPPIQARPISPR